MSPHAEQSRRLDVGRLEFDPQSGELGGPGGVQRIAPKPAALLALLASRPGELVTRDEIRERLWPAGKVEFEQGIAFAVREVRKAIESAGGDPAVVETIPKRGFRLAVPSPAAPDEAGRVARKRANSLGLLLPPLVAVGVIVAIGLGLSLSRRSPIRLPTVVVFAHDSQDGAYAELAGELGFELTTALTRAFDGRLGVIGPTGSAGVSDPNDTEAARASLGACLVVSGGIRAVGTDTVVVFTQIVRTLDRVHAWASQDTVPVASAAAFVPDVVEGVRSAASAC
ncbi:MAG: winged helix-turn-helix domain-containing protein [Gemmatimonadales bacterium]